MSEEYGLLKLYLLFFLMCFLLNVHCASHSVLLKEHSNCQSKFLPMNIFVSNIHLNAFQLVS